MTLVGTVWVPVGPSPISSNATANNGTTTAIALGPGAKVIYQGTAGGGVWCTTDGGSTWRPLFDRQVALGIGEPAGLAIDPSDARTIYVGTSSRLTAQTQAGLFKSTDGGASCVRLGSGYPAANVGNASQFIYQWINAVLVDPANSETIYLGSSLPPSPPPGVESGVFRSVDGGLNWTLGTNGSGSARSLVLDPSSPQNARVLYAGVSRRGVLKSTDGGQTWTPVLTAATPAVAAALGNGRFGAVVVALAPPAPAPDPRGIQVLYATMVGIDAPDPVGLFVSTDQGVTWKRRAAENMPGNTLGGYCLTIGVDPASPGDGVHDTLYVGCVEQAKSTDSGARFSDVLEGMHKDTHAWAFFPSAAGTVVYCANDGGIFRSHDGDRWEPLNGGGLQTSLFYNIDIKPDATADVTVGALLDNQTETTRGAGGLGWTGTNGGDGWDVAYDGQIARRVYTSSGFWKSPHPSTRVFRSDDDGMTWGSDGITPWRDLTSDTRDGPALIATDPTASGIVYVSGSDNLWQSTTGGDSWRIIKPFASRANIDVARGEGNNVVIAVSRPEEEDPNVHVEVGVFVSTNALAATGVRFTDITRNLPSRNVLRAKFDPNDPRVIIAVLGGFDNGPGETGHVFRTTIEGTAWMDISPSVNVPHGAIALDGADIPTTIYVGNDLGVLRSRDGGKSWTILDDIHFPRALVTDLVLNPEARVLRAATYGRGVFEFAEPDGPAIAVNLQDGLDFGICCGGPRFLTLQVFNVGKGNLVIDSVQPIMGAPVCLVLPSPGTPVVVGPDQEVDFTVQFKPHAPGEYATTIRISSNDPGAPHVDLAARGILGTGTLELVYADGGEFGNVRLGSFADQLLTVHNNGPCTLTISGASSSSAEFIVPGVDHCPLLVASGCSIDLPIRFKPTSVGPKIATISVTSNDPASSASVEVSGTAPSGALLVSGSTHFGGIELGRCTHQTVSICNTGHGDLHVSRVALECQCDSEHFCLADNPFPAMVQPGSCIGVVVEFTPTCARIERCALVIETDDPHRPTTTLRLTGHLHRTFSSTIRCWLRQLGSGSNDHRSVG